MAEAIQSGTPMAVRLGTDLFDTFPTNICETMNSELSRLGHVIQHTGRWTSQLYAHEMVDVLNMRTPARVRDARAAAQRMESRAGDAQASVAMLPRKRGGMTGLQFLIQGDASLPEHACLRLRT